METLEAIQDEDTACTPPKAPSSGGQHVHVMSRRDRMCNEGLACAVRMYKQSDAWRTLPHDHADGRKQMAAGADCQSVAALFEYDTGAGAASHVSLPAVPGGEQELSEARAMSGKLTAEALHGLPAHTHVASEESTRNGDRTGRRDWPLTQDFVAMYTGVFVFAFICALPRGLTLLAISTLDIPFVMAGLQEVLEEKVGFGNLIVECKATGNVWTGLSPGGQFHRTIIISDYFFRTFGLLLAFVASMYCFFPQTSRLGKAVRGLFTIIFAVGLAISLRQIIWTQEGNEGNLLRVLWGPANLLLYFFVYASYSTFLLSLCLLANLGQTGGVKRSWTVTFRGCAAVALVLVFNTTIDNIQQWTLAFISARASDASAKMIAMMIPLVLGKVVLMGMRIETSMESSIISPVMGMALSFGVTSVASMSARFFLFEGSLSAVFLNSVFVSILEILAGACIVWGHVFFQGTVLQCARINRLTLGELLHLEDRIAQTIYVHRGHTLASNVSEIAVCFNIAMQYLCVPQWVVRGTIDDYRTRVFRISSCLFVQMVMEVATDFLVVYLTYRDLEALVPFRALFERLLWNRTMILGCFGIMMTHGIAFWPKCTTCGRPWECLLYIECSRGAVKLGTEADVCRRYYKFNNDTNLELLALHNSQRRKHGLTYNLTLEDLACARQDVQCGDWVCPGIDGNMDEWIG